MALLIPGKTKCPLCGEIIQNDQETVAYPAFIPREHRLGKYSDEVFHRSCFEACADRDAVEQLYQQFRAIWARRPVELTSIDDIEAWGREAFKHLLQGQAPPVDRGDDQPERRDPHS